MTYGIPIRVVAGGLLLVGVLFLWTADAAVADECWIHTPSGYQGIGGSRKIGPYKDWYEANRINNQYFNGRGTIECTQSSPGGGGGPRFNYGAAKFHNRTSGTISFSVRRKPGGSWEDVKVASGRWHWWWQECPCRFHCTWDGSFAPGYQRRTREVYWYGYRNRPSDSDARDWQFVQRGQSIDLVPGSDAKIPAAPKPTPRVSVSLMGRGEGRADANSFRKAKSASGTFQLTFMPRVRGTIPTIDGHWQMQWRRIIGNRNDPNRKEVWTLTGSGFHGPGKREQTITLTMQGGAGTGSFWSTRVPDNPAAGTVRMKVHVQFSGGNVRLSFTKAP